MTEPLAGLLPPDPVQEQRAARRSPRGWTAAGRVRAVAAGVAGTAGTLVAASVLVFALVRSAPGDPVEIEFSASGADAFLTPEAQEQVREERRAALGLDGTLAEQYVRWAARVVRLDLGTSYRTGRPVTEELLERLPASAALGVGGFVVAVVLALVLAVLAARRAGGALDQVVRVLSLAVVAVPTFLSGSILLRWAATEWGYPLAGEATLAKLWLPALVIGVSSTPTMVRVLRASLLDEGGQPYALAAAARGAGPGRVLVRHVARPAATPLFTLAGLLLASLVAGSVITETVFAWPGVSAYAVNAITAQDFPVVQAYVLLVVVVVLVVNRSIDVLQALLDPRAGSRAEHVS